MGVDRRLPPSHRQSQRRLKVSPGTCMVATGAQPASADKRETAVKAVRNVIRDARAVDAVVVVVMTCLVFSAYLDAYAYVHVPSRVLTQEDRLGQAGVAASWFVCTAFLFFLFGRGLRRGRPWNSALPDGYTGSLAASLVFGAALIVDYNWSFATGNNPLGLDRLFTPPHIVEIAAAAVMVSGPLRASARRGDSTAGLFTLVSAEQLSLPWFFLSH